ncbi:hypothetical protein ASZ90_009646 [hydrocarbon metagenome]|uniref:Uncharacterized protein n=1 Tax=hydrocarbon metagenome TaxID=938273 RepID=A0A0W8FI83_9ZZZZ|nr:hypothetical protein [Methanomicrobiaceae archaeon]
MRENQTCGGPTAFGSIEGSDTSERFAAIGIVQGERADIRRLMELSERYGFEVYLYFDEYLARHSTLDADLRDFSIVPPHARPYMQLQQFVAAMKGRYPDFETRIRDDPVFAEIVDLGGINEFYGCALIKRPYVRGLLL